MTINNSKLSFAILLVVAIALLGILGFGVFYIRAKNQKTSELLNLVNEVASTRDVVKSIETMQYEAREELEAFENTVLTNEKLVSLIESIEGAGDSLALETKILSVEKTGDNATENPDIVRIVLETSGSWATTNSFLKAMESLPYRTMVDESSLYKSDKNWHLRMTLSTHLFN